MVKRAFSLALSITLAAGFALSVTLKEAHAYIDLGTGAFYLQMLVAVGFGSLFAIKVFWGRITSKVSRFFALIKGNKAEDL